MNITVAALVLASAILNALWNFATRRARGNLVALWISLLVAGVACLPFACAAGWGRLDATIVLYVLISCVANAFFYTLLAIAYQEGDISLVYPISRGGGVAGLALVAIALGIDKIQPMGGIGMAVICAGVILITAGQVTRGRHSTRKSVGLALAMSVTIVGYSLVDSQATHSVHPLAYICVQYLGTPLFMAPYVLATTTHRRQILAALTTQRQFILTVGPASAATYLIILYLYASRLSQVSYIVAFREFAVVIGSLLGFAFLGEKMTLYKILGIILITAGLVCIKIA